MRERCLAGPAVGELAADVLRAGGRVSLVATGHSMTPAIRSGDRLTIDPLRGAPRTGDVLACAIDSRLVIHRVVGRHGGLTEVRGDVAPASDPQVPVQALLGVVTRVERGHRRVRLGLGPERVLLAWLSHRGVLRRAAQWRLQIRGALLGSRISANIAHAELSIRARVAG
jgi:signal peptidase I